MTVGILSLETHSSEVQNSPLTCLQHTLWLPSSPGPPLWGHPAPRTGWHAQHRRFFLQFPILPRVWASFCLVRAWREGAEGCGRAAKGATRGAVTWGVAVCWEKAPVMDLTTCVWAQGINPSVCGVSGVQQSGVCHTQISELRGISTGLQKFMNYSSEVKQLGGDLVLDNRKHSTVLKEFTI